MEHLADFLLPPYEDTARCSIYKPVSKPLTATGSAGALILIFPSSRIVRNEFLLFASHPIYGVNLF
jgi:hypothetical protein